jgi:hypothetical protein
MMSDRGSRIADLFVLRLDGTGLNFGVDWRRVEALCFAPVVPQDRLRRKESQSRRGATDTYSKSCAYRPHPRFAVLPPVDPPGEESGGLK